MDQAHKFSKITIILHWIVGLSIIGLLISGTIMHEFDIWALYPIHKSIGMIVFVVAILRIFWRIKNGWPTPVGKHPRLEKLAAKIVHWVLIIGTVALPISGMMMSGAGGHGLAIFGLEIMAPNYVDGKAVAHNKTIASIGHTLHEVGAKLIIIGLVLHVVGALKHHFKDKDGTLRRMLGKSV